MKSTVDNYLEQSYISDSLFIDGDWGTGKTYFVKNHVIKGYTASSNRKVIYISLNGVSSNEELKSLILAKSIIVVENGSKRKVTDTIKSKAASILSKSEVGKMLLPSFNVSDFFVMKDILYVFDDLERISNSYSIANVFGVINSELIEENGFRVILIGNSKNIFNKNDFSLTKEKIIGWTLKFESNLKVAIPNIINDWKSIDKGFHVLIKKEEDFIIEMLSELLIINLRTVRKSLDYLKIINDSKLVPELLFREILYFTFILTNEIRNGNISGNVQESELPSFITYDISNHNRKDANPGVNINYDDFNRYYWNSFLANDNKDTKYVYFGSIFTFIQSGEFNLDDFKMEVDKLKIEKEFRTKSSEETIIDKIKFYYYLSNEKFIELKDEVVDLIKTGKFDFFQYLNISVFLLRLKKEKPFLLDGLNINKLLIDNAEKVNLQNIDMFYYQNKIENVIGDKDLLPSKLYNILLKKVKAVVAKEIKDTTDKLLVNLEQKHFDQNHVHSIIKNSKVEDIVETLVKNMANREFLDSFVYKLEKFYNSSNAGDFYLEEAKKLDKLSRHFNKLIKDGSFEVIDKVWILKIRETFNLVGKHIRSSVTK